MQIKICGIKRLQDARAAVKAGASAIGLNFVPESPRFIGSLADALHLLDEAAVRHAVRWAGVFVNPTHGQVFEAVEKLDLDIVQLHGDEDPRYVATLRRELARTVQIWKAVRVATAGDLASVPECNCDAWVVDSKVAGMHGGSGQTFDWSLLKNFRRSKPLVLSGGLNPANVGDAVKQVRAEWFDVASGVESSPGAKDAALMERFIRAAKAADQQS